MKWFDKWFYNKTRWCWHRAGQEYPEWKKYQDYLDEAAEENDNQESTKYSLMSEAVPKVHDDDSSSHDLYDGIRIFVKRLNGGYIVTFRHPADRSAIHYSDEHRKNSYIVNEDEDFGDRLVKLLTMELLKR